MSGMHSLACMWFHQRHDFSFEGSGALTHKTLALLPPSSITSGMKQSSCSFVVCKTGDFH